MIKKPANPVRLLNAALDDGEGVGSVVFRGTLSNETLRFLLTDDYQREAQPMSSQKKILSALKSGDRLPDVELGMRGENFHQREGAVLLKDDVYIIDGLQRITTVINFVGENPGANVQLGAVVHLNTTREWERERFHKLNNWRLRISPNVLLRNKREGNDALLMLYGLSHNDKSFPLYQRVSWEQKMRRGDYITSLMFAKIAGRLHGHLAPGRASVIDELAGSLARAAKIIGVQTMRDNLKNFFNLIDAAWGIRGIQYRESAIYMRTTFLNALSAVLSNHHDFWKNDKHLFVEANLIRKIASFPINDPQVIHLAGSAGKAQFVLGEMMVDHINSGKRTKRLSPRLPRVVAPPMRSAVTVPIEEEVEETAVTSQ